MTALSLPAAPKIKASTFKLERRESFNPTRDGAHQAVELGEPFWSCELSTTELSRAQGGSYKLMMARLGTFGTLYVFDQSRPRPLAYHAGGSWGSPMIESVSRANGTITLSGFAAGAVISAGDYGHWDDGPTRRLHICGPGVADGAGALTLQVEPAPPQNAVASFPVAFTMSKASAEMVVRDRSIRFSAPLVQELSLAAVQVFRRS